MNNPELEMMFEIWNSEWHYEIGPDRDGLGLLEIRYYDNTGDSKASHRMTFTPAEAKLVIKALTRLLDEVPGCGEKTT